MIKNLSGDFETVEYAEKHFILLYDNVDHEDYPVHWHNAIEIIMPLQNRFTVCTNSSVYELNERDVIMIPPGELHSLKAPEEGRRLIFQCDNSVLGENAALGALSSLFSETQCITSQSDSELRIFAKKTMLDIYDNYYSKSEFAELKIYAELLDLLIELQESRVKQAAPGVSGKLGEYNEKFSLVMKYIDKNYMYDITLDKLADIAGYSKYHFSRIFRQYNSVSYIDYINSKRIKSAEMLLLSDLPITEVAMRSGFSSLTTFNRIFKSIKHCTPSDFKKLYRSAQMDKGV